MEIGEMVPQVLLPLRTGPRRRKADLEFGTRQEARDLIKALVCDVIPALPDDGISTTVDFAADTLVPAEPAEAGLDGGEQPDDAYRLYPATAEHVAAMQDGAAADDSAGPVIVTGEDPDEADGFAAAWLRGRFLAAQETAQPQGGYPYPRLSRFMPVDPETFSGPAIAMAPAADERCSPGCGYYSSGQDLLQHWEYEHSACTECGAEPHGGDAVIHKMECPRLQAGYVYPVTGAEPQPVVSLLAPCPAAHPRALTPCGRLDGHPLPHRDHADRTWGNEPHPAAEGEPRCGDRHDAGNGGILLCGAQEHHGGHFHAAYGASGAAAHRWPVAAETVPAGAQ